MSVIDMAQFGNNLGHVGCAEKRVSLSFNKVEKRFVCSPFPASLAS
jgi:hypothetical protein